jgi:hypothetical protein
MCRQRRGFARLYWLIAPFGAIVNAKPGGLRKTTYGV